MQDPHGATPGGKDGVVPDERAVAKYGFATVLLPYSGAILTMKLEWQYPPVYRKLNRPLWRIE